MKKLLIFVFVLFPFIIVTAQIQMPSLFNDGMVLQCGQENKLWGTTEAGQTLTLSFNGQIQSTIADSNGNFSFSLSGLSVSNNPQTLTITAGIHTKEIHDVLVGNVFLLSGQSNMAWRLNQLDADIMADALADADYPNIRYYTVAKNYEINKIWGNDNLDDTPWVKTSVQTAPAYSALGFYFGRKLFKDKQIPIGLIDCSQGSSNADAWISQTYIDSHPELKPYLATPAQNTNEQYFKTPGILYEKMLSRVLPYTVCSVLWYQGEANAATYQKYPKVLPAVIDCFRQSYDNNELPFVIIQLSAYENTNFWPYIREIQDSVASVTPHAAMVSTIDVGDATRIHPQQKEPVGERCVLAIRNLVFGEDVNYSGPSFKSLRIEGNKAIITFNHAEGLFTKDNILAELEICDNSYIYRPVTNAGITRNELTVWNSAINDPVAVRYAWSNFPTPNLYNNDRLPANPFRTSKKENSSVTIYHITPGGSGLKTGYDWDNALDLTPEAMKLGKNGDEFWVKGGIYQTNIDCNNRAVYGGFNGTETERDQRDWEKNPTIIQGVEEAQAPLAVVQSSGILDGFILQDNQFAVTTAKNGAGIQLGAKGTIRNCIIRNNRTIGTNNNNVGGGVFVVGVKTDGIYPTIENSLITNNAAPNNGGGIQIGAGAALRIVNSTIADNLISKMPNEQGSGFGCGVGLAPNTNMIAENCIFYNNRKTDGSVHAFGTNKGGANPPKEVILRHCAYDVIGMGSGTNETLTFDETTACIENISSVNTPMFKQETSFAGTTPADSETYTEFTTANYSLLPASPCIDAGHNSYTTMTKDLSGNTRILGKSIDIGAYEYNPGSSNVKQVDSNIHYYMDQDRLIIDGLNPGWLISIYDLTGNTVYSSVATERCVSAMLPAHGLYIVKVEDHAQKILY